MINKETEILIEKRGEKERKNIKNDRMKCPHVYLEAQEDVLLLTKISFTNCS